METGFVNGLNSFLRNFADAPRLPFHGASFFIPIKFTKQKG